MRLVDISRGRPANTNGDRRRGPRLKSQHEALVRVYFEMRRQTLYFPCIDGEDRDESH